MKHPIKCVAYVIAIASTGIGLVGCSKQDQPLAQKDPPGITPEQKAARDLQKSNEAVTEIGKKIGKKAKPIDLNLPAGQKPEQAVPPATTKP